MKKDIGQTPSDGGQRDFIKLFVKSYQLIFRIFLMHDSLSRVDDLSSALPLGWTQIRLAA
jgi:hypothetical protein